MFCFRTQCLQNKTFEKCCTNLCTMIQMLKFPHMLSFLPSSAFNCTVHCKNMQAYTVLQKCDYAWLFDTSVLLVNTYVHVLSPFFRRIFSMTTYCQLIIMSELPKFMAWCKLMRAVKTRLIQILMILSKMFKNNNNNQAFHLCLFPFNFPFIYIRGRP